jgi:hypothetical protein
MNKNHLFLGAIFFGFFIPVSSFSSDRYQPYFIKTKQHVFCNFKDGSYFEYKKRKKDFLIAKLLPHVQSSEDLDEYRFYKDQYKKVRKDLGFIGGSLHKGDGDLVYLSAYASVNSQACISVGKRNGQAFTTEAFQDQSGRWRFFLKNIGGEKKEVDIESVPLPLPVSSVNQAPEKRDFLKKNSLFVASDLFFILPDEGQNALFAEQPLTALNHPVALHDTVLFVHQSVSNNMGKTWSEPVITTQAKLFEIGKEVTKQSWSARVIVKAQ